MKQIEDELGIITTRDGLLICRGKVLDADIADAVARRHGYAFAEKMVKDLAATPSLADLAARLFDAKRREDQAKKDRIAAEEAIAELIETDPNGSKTVDAGNGVKVTVKRALGYSVDVAGMRAFDEVPAEVLPLKLTPPIPAGYEFDAKAYEELKGAHPDAFAKLAQFVEIKPRKVSVTLKLA